MSACCDVCKGKGATVEHLGDGRTLTSCCYACQGSGGWNEIDGNVTGHWGEVAAQSKKSIAEGQK